jgi:hypothetical protein
LFRTYGKSELPEEKAERFSSRPVFRVHELSLVTQAKHSKPDWQDVVGRMIGNGATVEARRFLRWWTILSKNFGLKFAR